MSAKTELFSRWLGGNLVVADQGLSTGRRVFVHSTDGTDAAGYGASPDAPVATLDYAVSLCTDNEHDIIYLMPGHTESRAVTGELADLDIAGIVVQGMGAGADRPIFTLGHATAKITVDGASITIRNIRVVSDVADCAQALDVGAAADGLTIEDCEFEDGGTDVTELKEAIKIAAACDDVTIRNCRFLTAAGGTITSAITFEGASDNSRIERCYFNGDFGTSAILGSAAAQTRLLLLNNWMKVLDGEPGIELHANSEGVIADNRIESTSITDPDAAIVAADCSWFENYVVDADGGTAQLIGTGTESVQGIGTLFSVKKTITKTAIVAAGVDVTAASSGGALLLEDCILQNDTTEIDSAGHAEVIEFYTNNAAGSTSFMTIAASVLASEMRDLRDATTGMRVVLESGKKVTVKATTEDVTSGGTCDVYLIFRRLAAGAAVAAA